jgi:pantoate--beta-alanine ligase
MMKIFKTQRTLKDYLSSIQGEFEVGFVPTMGSLHQGHLSLIQNAKKRCDIVVCSIFVNPTQFNKVSDFTNYPKDSLEDIELLQTAGCDILFLPNDVNEVYQNEEKVSLELGNIVNVLEGEHRPGHFDGVIRVVKLLFDIVKPDKAFFGLKDFQQFLVIQKMAKVLNMEIEVLGCDIIREDNGLAMSSRNKRLSNIELKNALVLQKALHHCKNNFGKIGLQDLQAECFGILQKESEPEYFEICDAESLLPITEESHSENIRAFTATSIGEIRLIDNIEIV